MSTRRQLIMESSQVLRRFELTASSAAAGVIEVCTVRPQGQAPLNGCVPLSHQVAGHKFGVDKMGILQHPDGTVLKQLQPPPRGPREMQFYSMVYARDCCDPCLLELQNHLPKYYGTWASPDSPQDLYLKLEDVTRHFNKPCIMDVKLGQQSYDPFASQEKREQQIRKYPLMEEIGFLVLGMRVYKVCSDTFEIYDQHYGRELIKDTVKDGLAKFFFNGVTLRKDAVSASICRVQQILRWFESQQQLNFYASSLLFVYEGLPSSFSFPSHFSTPSTSSFEGKIAMLATVSDNNWGRVGKTTQEEVAQEEKVVECNNNRSIQEAVSWKYSMTSIYNNHVKDGLNHCSKCNLHGNNGGIDVVKVKMSQVSGSNISVSCKEGTSMWKCAGKPQQPPIGSRSTSQLEENDEDRQREDTSWGSRREEEKLKGLAGDPNDVCRGKSEVEVRMIDFAHVFTSESHDHGYIYGLRHLLGVLDQILNESA